MKNKIVKIFSIFLIIVLLSVWITNTFLENIFHSDRGSSLEDLMLNEEMDNSNNLAIMIEQSDGQYKEIEDTKWPSDMIYNWELSNCVDRYGNKIENALTYENGFAQVRTTETSFCYLYFDKGIGSCKQGDMLSQCIIENNIDIWESTLEDDGYRFVGTNPNNYICFGTSNRSKCINNTEKYLYRIIGIFEDSEGNQHLKLIKNNPLSLYYPIHSDYTIDVDWDESDLHKGLNGSYFLNNSTYDYMQDTNWIDKITTWNYTATNTLTDENWIKYVIAGPNYYNTTPVSSIYLHELNRDGKSNSICYYGPNNVADCNVGEWKTVSSKISLMYASDYNLALGIESLNYSNTSDGYKFKNGWIHLDKNEWTMSRRGNYGDGRYLWWGIRQNGGLGSGSGSLSVRPVFYLRTNEIYVSGSGLKSNPLLLNPI